MEQKFGVSWYGKNASIACTGFIFDRETAIKVAVEGSTAEDFGLWMDQQEDKFQIDYLTDPNDTPVVRADVETEEQSNEFVAWSQVGG